MEKHIHESNLIENIDSTKEDKQSLLAWDWLKDQDELTKGIICRIQKIITINQTDLRADQRGYYRSHSKVNVGISGTTVWFPPWALVDVMMAEWVEQHGKGATDSLTAHIRFEKIHPFRDGNGRTGRMLMWWSQRKNGTDPTLFLNSTKFEKYYPLFK